MLTDFVNIEMIYHAKALEMYTECFQNIRSFDVEEDLLEGPAAEAILSVAEIRKADLIILGTRGMGSFKGLLVGFWEFPWGKWEKLRKRK